MITLLGPTASGKTDLAVRLADRLGDTELLSADSRQVYRGMDIGTGKDLSAYQRGERSIPYHLIDLVPAGTKFSLFAWQRAFHEAYTAIRERGNIPLLCGGTGLYAEAVLKGYQLPDVPPNEQLRESLAGASMEELREKLASYGPLHNTTDLDSPARAIRAIEIADFRAQSEEGAIDHTAYPPIPSVILCMTLPREDRRRRITERLHARLEQGMLQEVAGLLESGIAPEDLIYYGLEYKYLTQHLLGELSYDAMVTALETAIHQFAKRQMTWFRGMERRGFTVHYIDALLSPTEQEALALWHIMRWYQMRRQENLPI